MRTIGRYLTYLVAPALMIGAALIGVSLSLLRLPTPPEPLAHQEFIAHEEPRSEHWPAVRRAHLAKEPACAVCGSKDGLQVHHVQSFRTNPALELDPENLITLCQHDHFVWGHLLNWRSDAPDIREEIARFKERVRKAKETQ